MSNKQYQAITEKIITKLNAGVIPWQKPFQSYFGLPKNMTTQKDYRGINILLLGSELYQSPNWLTYNQVKKLNGSVKKGEKSQGIFFFKLIESEVDDDKTPKQIPLLKKYSVFHITQTTLEDPFQHQLKSKPKFRECETIISGDHLPNSQHGRSRAAYNPEKDKIIIPYRKTFKSVELYYSVVFHELIHATGHKDRLNRTLSTDSKTDEYAEEELIAELGASMLCAHFGFENQTVDDSASYIQGWINALRNDHKLIYKASSKAQKAVDYILSGGG